MALVSQSSPIVIQPIIAALKKFQSSVIAWGEQNGLNTDAGTTSSLYVAYAQMLSLSKLLLGLYQNTQSKNTIQVRGGSLYEVAALYYKDVLQAFTLMTVNSLWSPWLPSSVPETINIPPAQTTTPATGFGPVTKGLP